MYSTPKFFLRNLNTRVNSHSTSRAFAGPPAFLAGWGRERAKALDRRIGSAGVEKEAETDCDGRLTNSCLCETLGVFV